MNSQIRIMFALTITGIQSQLPVQNHPNLLLSHQKVIIFYTLLKKAVQEVPCFLPKAQRRQNNKSPNSLTLIWGIWPPKVKGMESHLSCDSPLSFLSSKFFLTPCIKIYPLMARIRLYFFLLGDSSSWNFIMTERRKNIWMSQELNLVPQVDTRSIT